MASGGGSGRPFSAKQWFAIKSKLKKQGKWDEKRKAFKDQTSSKPNAKSKHPRSKRVPVQSNTLDNYQQEGQATFREVEGEEFNEVNEIFDAFEEDQQQGKYLMNNNERKQEQYFFSESDSDTSKCDTGEIPITIESDSENELESQNLLCDEKIPDSPISILHEGGDIPREAWEIKRAFRNMQISSGTRERCRIAGIPETAGTIRDNTVILFRVGQPKFWDEIKIAEEWEIDSYTHYESYFQTYNSIAVVIRCLPDDHITTTDINEKLIACINDPYLIVCEKSDEGVLHWHMIWLTSKRSDNAKRILQKALSNLPGSVSISCQQTRSFKHLIRYLLKNPITLSVVNCDALTKYTFALMKEMEEKKNDTEVTPANLGEFPNQMVKDIIQAMNLHKKYTYEELVYYAPQVMQKYLHKPNLESIVHNCKLFLHRPNDTLLTFERILTSYDDYSFTDLFPIWFFLDYQGIEPGDFILDFWNVIFKLSDKRNVLAIQGPSNTGKTTFIRPLAEIFNWGEIVQGGQFMFQNCINKELLLWEEPLIGSDYVEMCKRVFEGMTTQVNIKFKAPQTLYRTPIIITTNKDIWHYCDSDETAFKNRMFLYMFTNNASIPTLNKRVAKESFRKYCRWLTAISFYFTDCDESCTSGPEYSSAENASSNCGFHRELYKCRGSSEQLCSDTDEQLTGRVDDRGRRSSSISKEFKRTERSRSPIDHSSSAYPSIGGARITAGNTTRRRSFSEEGSSLYSSALTNLRRDNRLGGEPRIFGGRANANSGRDHKYVKLLRENCQFLRSCGRGYSALKKIFQEVEFSSKPELDREISDSCLDKYLFQPSTRNQWLSLLQFGFNCAKVDNLL